MDFGIPIMISLSMTSRSGRLRSAKDALCEEELFGNTQRSASWIAWFSLAGRDWMSCLLYTAMPASAAEVYSRRGAKERQGCASSGWG